MSKKQEKFYMGNQNLPSKGTVISYTPEQIKEMQKCSKNILHFAEKYFYILNVDDGKIPIKLYKAQKRVLKQMMDHRFFCLLASRQVGKALALDTPIKTPTGWTTMGDLKAGDVVYGSNGQPCNVTHAHEISKLGCYIYVRYLMLILDGNTKEEAAKIFRTILEGKGTYEQNAAVLANAAKALQNTGKFENYEASLSAAKDSLESGKALNSLQLLVDC